LALHDELKTALSSWGSDLALPEVSPLVVAALELASTLDEYPTVDSTYAALFREYRMTLKDLREVVKGGADSGVAELLDELRRAPMGNTANSD